MLTKNQKIGVGVGIVGATIITFILATREKAVEAVEWSIPADSSPYDLDGDGRITQKDVDLFKSVFGHYASESDLARRADFNHDGKVNISDFGLMSVYISGHRGG